MIPSTSGKARRKHKATRPGRHAGWPGFVERYGWRAYALPTLIVLTIAAFLRGNDAHKPQPAAAGHTGTQSGRSATKPASHDGSSGAGAKTRVEGLDATDNKFQAGAAPSPVVVSLGSDTTSCASNSEPQLIIVSISKQHLWACDGARQVNETAVTTGSVLDHDQTPLGSWRVQAKQRDRYLVGPGYKDYVHYWVPFNGDFGLHDAPWQTMPFGSADWRTQGSHGCVHTPTAKMSWLYHWAQVGRTVVTVES